MRLEHAMPLIRQGRGEGEYAGLTCRFRLASERLAFNRDGLDLDVTRFQPPARAGDQPDLSFG